MAQRGQTLCMTCGLAVGSPPRLNALPNGASCPACKDRALDWIPAALPSREPHVAETEEQLGLPADESEGPSDWADRPERA